MRGEVDDLEIWIEFRKNQKFAFSLLYKRYVKTLYKYGQRLTSDNQLIEDAIQDMFIELWHTRQNLSNPDSVKFYLLSVLRRSIFKKIKFSNSQKGLEDYSEHSLLKVPSVESDFTQAEHASELSYNLHKSLVDLPPRQLEAINLRFFQSLSHTEISELMGISTQSVQNVIQKALKTMQTSLSPGLNVLLMIYLLWLKK